MARINVLPEAKAVPQQTCEGSGGEDVYIAHIHSLPRH
jgi:hypothetical protein